MRRGSFGDGIRCNFHLSIALIISCALWADSMTDEKWRFTGQPGALDTHIF